MISKKQYIAANIKLEKLIKELDLGHDVDDELISVSNIIEEYEEINYPIRLSKEIELGFNSADSPRTMDDIIASKKGK